MMEWRMLGRGPTRVTALGFGGGPVGWAGGAEADRLAAATLGAAWEGGIRYFDTAPFYGHGQGERRVGAFLSGCPRAEFVLSTKVGRLIVDGQPAFDYSRDGTLRSLGDSLSRLGLTRIDLALVHDIDRYTHGEGQPERMRAALDGALPALADLKSAGVIGGFGLGVNEWQVCAEVAARLPLDAILLAGRYTLLEQGAAGFMDRAAAEGIGIIIGGPYNSGILATGAQDDALYDYAPAPAAIRDRVARIEDVLARHGVPLPTAALRFPLRHAAVASVIPGMVGADQVAETQRLWSRPVAEAVWHDLAANGLIPAPTGAPP
jgi:D-threo-aldose 1-dehydrogenase